MIRQAAREDLPAVVALLEQERLPTEGVAEHFGTYLVAGDLAGVVGLEAYGRQGLLRSLAVRPESRGRGLGGALVEACLDLARARRIGEVYLLTETAAAYFPRFGFAPVAREAIEGPVRESAEFRGACAESAVAMRLAL